VENADEESSHPPCKKQFNKTCTIPLEISTLFSARPKSRREARLAHAVNFTIATRQANFIAQIAPTDGDQERRRDLPVREHSLLRRRLERDPTSGLEKSQVDFDESRPYCAFSTSDSAIGRSLELDKNSPSFLECPSR